MVSSAWRRKPQSWLTRTLPSGFRCPQPSAVGLIDSDPVPLPASARSSASSSACSRPDDIDGAVFSVTPELNVGALSCPVAAFLMWLSLAEVAIGGLTTNPTARAANASTDRIRLLIAPFPQKTTDVLLNCR